MRKNTATMVSLLVLTLLGSCQSNTACSMMADCLIELHERTSSHPSWEETDTVLLNDEQFLQSYAAAERSLTELIDVIQSDSSEEVKLLAILIAQGLEIDSYVEFVNIVLESKARGHASDKLVAYCVYPGASWGTGLVELVDRPDVQAILELAEKTASAQILTNRIAAVRDGSYRKYLDHLRERGDVIPTVAAKLGKLEQQ